MALETNPNYPNIKLFRQVEIRRKAKQFYQEVKDNPTIGYKTPDEIFDSLNDIELMYFVELLEKIYGLKRDLHTGIWEKQ